MSVVASLDNVNSWVDLIVGFGHFACGVATLWMTELRINQAPRERVRWEEGSTDQKVEGVRRVPPTSFVRL